MAFAPTSEESFSTSIAFDDDTVGIEEEGCPVEEVPTVPAVAAAVVVAAEKEEESWFGSFLTTMGVDPAVPNTDDDSFSALGAVVSSDLTGVAAAGRRRRASPIPNPRLRFTVLGVPDPGVSGVVPLGDDVGFGLTPAAVVEAEAVSREGIFTGVNNEDIAGLRTSL